MRESKISIDQSALQHNLGRVRQLAPHSQVVAMVKANAYGHGVTQVLAGLADADIFGVACSPEGIELRNLGCEKKILLVEGVCSEKEMEVAIEQRFECVVAQPRQIEWLLKYGTDYQQKKLKVWVKINTGMNRLGFKVSKEEDSPAEQILQRLIDQGFDCVVMMHFANADDIEHPMNQQQIDLLKKIKRKFPQLQYSCCNSAAIFNWSDLHFDYVRPGIMLYGASPFMDKTVHELDLQAVMDFTTQIIDIYDIKKGDAVGYASSFIAKNDMTLAVLAVGYGDGYPRAYQHPTKVWIAGHFVDVVGRVSMDMMTVDVSHIKHLIQINDRVELWGKHLSVDDLASAYQTISYELLCRITQRPTRETIASADHLHCN